VLIATSAGALGDLIDVYTLPSKDLLCKDVGKNPPEQLGMTMCLSLTRRDDDQLQFTLVAGYESGCASVYTVSASSWSLLYSFKAHTQPILSLAITPAKESFYTSSADANVVRHPIAIATQPLKTIGTQHAGQTSLTIRDDGRILVTGGWDGVGRVYSGSTLRQVAVLKWHVGGLQAAEFSGSINGKRLIVLGGKDAKISFWDVFN
jgi:ASTRA-associated protein 1